MPIVLVMVNVYEQRGQLSRRISAQGLYLSLRASELECLI